MTDQTMTLFTVIPFSFVIPLSFVIPVPYQVRDKLQPESRGSTINKQPVVYILSNKRNGTLYIGITSDLVKRVWEHKNGLTEGFTKRYGLDRLVWYEPHETMVSAIVREKRLKDWKRAWKLELIEEVNPDWRDLYDSIF